MNGLGEPVAFGDARIFGFFHRPPPDRTRNVGVVLINPLGYEAVCAHRCYRHFAERLACAGYPALRYDHPGSGDSAGDDEQPSSLREGLRLAIDALSRLTESRRVVLFGVRAGALLGLSAANERQVAGVFAWAPPRHGRAWLRELTLLSDHPRGATGGGLESAGFWYHEALLEELRSLSQAVPAGNNLVVVPRDDLPDPPHSGARQLPIPGYAEMMTDPHRSKVPPAVAQGLIDVLDQWSTPARPTRQASPAAVIRFESGREEALRFGETQQFGVLCEPECSRPEAPVVLMLNPGAVHRIGMNRLYVRWARSWARQGIASLRFDITGIGDSPAVPGASDNQLYSLHAVEDVRRAIDLLEQRYPQRPVCLMGLCSGAYAAYHTALADRRVCRAVLINPQTFCFRPGDSLDVKWRKSYQATRYYRRRLGHRDAWLRLLKGQVGLRRAAGLVLRRSLDVARLSARDWAARAGLYPPSEVTRALDALADAGVRVGFVYSSDDPGLAVLRAELGPHYRRCFARPELSVELIDGPDHTFTPRWSQQRLSECVETLLMEAPLTQPARHSAAPAPWDVYPSAARASG